MLYKIISKVTHRFNKKKNYDSHHIFIAHAEDIKQLKAYFKASKPDYKIVEVIQQDADIMELL